MLTVIGLLPATFGLNIDSPQSNLHRIGAEMSGASDLIQRYGDDKKDLGIAAAKSLGERLTPLKSLQDVPGPERIALRNDAYRVLAETETIGNDGKVPKDDQKTAKAIHKSLGTVVTYAPWWVRILSAIALGLGTMIGYKRIREDAGRAAR